MIQYLKALTYEHGNNLTLSGYGVSKTHYAIRSTISGFSRKSRQRIMRTLTKIDIQKVIGTPLFLTLTYPDKYPSDPKTWKKHLDTFTKRVIHNYPHLVMIWRMEFQKRGAPHFHLVLLNCNRARVTLHAKTLTPKLNLFWFETVGSNDYRHFKAGINISPIKSYRALTSYVTKYISKEESEEIIDNYPEDIGRFWGIVNRTYLPVTEVEVELSPEEFQRLRRICRNYLERKIDRQIYLYSAHSGITIYIDYYNAHKLIDFIKKE